MSDIYTLGLHESLTVCDSKSPYMKITRVAGGWIYGFQNGATIYVPFDNEFMELSKKTGV